MELYVVRHGLTDTNKKHLVNGRKESKLTLQGKMQALKLRKEVKNIDFDVVISSPLQRAIKTAKIITKKDIIIKDILTERSYGDFEGQKKKSFPYTKYWNYNLNLSDHNVESIKDLFKRTEKIINTLKEKYPNKKVLIVTHSGLFRAINYYLNGIPSSGDLTKLKINNCSIKKYKIKE